MLSPFKSKELVNNYNELALTSILKMKDDVISRSVLEVHKTFTRQLTLLMRVTYLEDLFLNNSITQRMINSSTQYDMAIVMWYGNDVILALAQHLAKNTVILSTLSTHYEITELTKTPAPLSYVPDLYSSLTDEMNFIQRLQNFFKLVKTLCFNIVFKYQQKILLNKYFPNAPPIDELHKHVSLVLLNTHFSIESPRPYVPQIVHVGGLHLEESNELSGKLKEIVDEAKEGVILFILGSNIKSSDLGEEKLNGIIRCFSKLPYQILWKYEKDDLNLPKNVKINSWFPQKDLLGHKNVKLFISHGGLLSATEALYHGVPMIGIPIFGDQDKNINDGVHKGYIVQVQYSELSEETLCKAIKEILNNSSYHNSVKKWSRVFRDQPLKPLDKAVYWVEYVLRHNGAHHLKTGAFKLNWFVLHSIDVIASITVVIFSSLCVICKIFSYLYQFLFAQDTKVCADKHVQKFKVA